MNPSFGSTIPAINFQCGREETGPPQRRPQPRLCGSGLGPARGSVSQGRPSAPTPRPPTDAARFPFQEFHSPAGNRAVKMPRNGQQPPRGSVPYKDPEKRRESVRKWRAANREKTREANRKWRLANLEKSRQVSHAYRQANLERVRAYQRKYRAAKRARAKEGGGSSATG